MSIKRNWPWLWLTSKSKDEYQFERRWYGSNPEQLQLLAEWLCSSRWRKW